MEENSSPTLTWLKKMFSDTHVQKGNYHGLPCVYIDCTRKTGSDGKSQFGHLTREEMAGALTAALERAADVEHLEKPVYNPGDTQGRLVIFQSTIAQLDAASPHYPPFERFEAHVSSHAEERGRGDVKSIERLRSRPVQSMTVSSKIDLLENVSGIHWKRYGEHGHDLLVTTAALEDSGKAKELIEKLYALLGKPAPPRTPLPEEHREYLEGRIYIPASYVNHAAAATLRESDIGEAFKAAFPTECHIDRSPSR